MRQSADELVSGLAKYLASRSPRRSFLASAGRLALTTAGVSAVATALPVFTGTAGAAACSDWQLCGMFGTMCNCCGGTEVQCPPSSLPGTFWSACCREPSKGGRFRMEYHDCCRTCSCSSGAGCVCGNGNTQHAFCGLSGRPYCCTYYRQTTSC